MANITIEIPDELLERLQSLAAEKQASLDQLVEALSRQAINESNMTIPAKKPVSAQSLNFRNRLDEHFLNLKGMI